MTAELKQSHFTFRCIDSLYMTASNPKQEVKKHTVILAFADNYDDLGITSSLKMTCAFKVRSKLKDFDF